jgi:hypothetical protein
MPDAPSVDLHVPTDRLPAMITRLTTYLLHYQYSFLQTCHEAGHVEFAVFTQPAQPLIRLTLRGVDGAGSGAEACVAAVPRTLAEDAVHLVQHLVQAERVTEEAMTC